MSVVAADSAAVEQDLERDRGQRSMLVDDPAAPAERKPGVRDVEQVYRAAQVDQVSSLPKDIGDLHGRLAAVERRLDMPPQEHVDPDADRDATFNDLLNERNAALREAERNRRRADQAEAQLREAQEGRDNIRATHRAMDEAAIEEVQKLRAERDDLAAEVKASAKQCMEIAGERDDLRQRAERAETTLARIRVELAEAALS